MYNLVIATRNKKKLTEIREILSDLNVNIMSIEDFPDAPDVLEDGKTFEDNARKKAVQIAQFTNYLTLADDSGLEIDYLQGQPGVYSSRFAGENATDSDRNMKVLGLMKNVSPDDRKARFRCAIAIARPDGYNEVVIGMCQGQIALEPRGNQGFGYDPIFVMPEYGKTYAELGLEKKNQISHRALALKKAREVILRMFDIQIKNVKEI